MCRVKEVVRFKVVNERVMVCKIVKELMEFIEDECLEFMEVVVLFLGLFLMVVFDFEIL